MTLIAPYNKSAVMLIIAVILISLSGCTKEALSDEEQIRALIEKAELEAEKRNTGALLDLVDDSFSGWQRYNKTQLEKILRLYFFRHQSIYLLTRIKDIELIAADYAEATVFVAMAGSAIADISAITSLRASIYRFDLTFTKDERWLLSSARWDIARMEDLQ